MRLVLLVLAVALLLSVPAWPAGGPPPQEARHVEYDLHWSFTAPDGSYRLETTARLALRQDGQSWSGTCSGATTEVVDGVTASSSWSFASGGGPVLAPAGARRGDTVVLPMLEGGNVAERCRQRGLVVEVAAMRRHATELEDDRGRPVSRTAWLADEDPGTSGYQDAVVTWDRGTGLLLDWSCAIPGGSFAGRLVATDAFSR